MFCTLQLPKAKLSLNDSSLLTPKDLKRPRTRSHLKAERGVPDGGDRLGLVVDLPRHVGTAGVGHPFRREGLAAEARVHPAARSIPCKATPFLSNLCPEPVLAT